MNTFNELGYQIVPSVISKETAQLVSIEFEMLRDNLFYRNNIPLITIGPQNDPLVEKSFSWYGAYATESLLKMLHPKMEEIIGKKLHPTYSYARIYYPNAEMPKHSDRPSCEYSATLTISVDPEPWEIWFTDFKNESKPLILNVGDMCVYQGTKLEHWRDSYTGTKQIQAFLHYVEVGGPYDDYKFDKRDLLGQEHRNV
jgi:hypothetical protein